MSQSTGPGRSNQRLRTRKDLLLAATQLLKKGRSPSMSEIADRAMVSRATAYRYFSSAEAVLIETTIDESVQDPEEIFSGDSSASPEERAVMAEAVMHESVYRKEAQLRIMLAHTLAAGADAKSRDGRPVRQNRRTAYIDAALAPFRDHFDEDSYQKLRCALAMIFGTESMVVFRDVVPISEDQARQVKAWSVRTLVRAAAAESSGES